MHILVFGGTGACGQEFVLQAVHSGHDVTLYARNPSKLIYAISRTPSVHIVKGELDDERSLKESLEQGAEVMVSFLGPNVPSRGMAITEFYERFYRLLPNSSIRRCMVLSTATYKVPDDRESLKWWFGIWFIYLIGGSAYNEIMGLSQATAALSSNIEWTLFRVPGLNNAAKAKPVRAGLLGSGADGLFLSRVSLAIWVMQELEDRKWIGQAPALSNAGWLGWL